MTTLNATLTGIDEPVDVASTARVQERRMKTACTLIWVVGLLAGLEFGLRARAVYRHGSASPVAGIYEADETHGRRLKPGATLTGKERRLSINDWGFRGAQIPKAKPANTIRIAALGDSTTFGLEASSDDAVWVSQMVRTLNDDGAIGKRFDAINAAVPGYTLDYSVHQMQANVAEFSPDIVVLLQTSTDIAAHSRRQWPRSSVNSPPRNGIARWVHRHSLLLNLVRVNAATFSGYLLGRDPTRRLDEDGLTDYRRGIRQLIDISEADNRRVVLCTCPRSFGDRSAPTSQAALATSALASNTAISLAGLNDAYDRYNDAIRSVAKERGVALVDLATLVPQRGDYFVDAVHLNDRGHQLVAQAVARTVAREIGRPPAADGINQ